MNGDTHAGGKRGCSEEGSRKAARGSGGSGAARGSQDPEVREGCEELEEDTREFLELVCEEEDWERLRRTGSLRKEEKEPTEDESGDTSVDEPLPPNDTLEQFLDDVVPHPGEVEENEDEARSERSESGEARRDRSTGGGESGEDEDHDGSESGRSYCGRETESDGWFSVHSRRSRNLDVEESRRRGLGRDPGARGDGSEVRDFWNLITNRPYKRVRVHAKKRRKLYVPTQRDLAFPLSCLKSERRTVLVNQQNVQVVIDDNWRTAGEVDVGYGEWCGFAFFKLLGGPDEQYPGEGGTGPQGFDDYSPEDEEGDATDHNGKGAADHRSGGSGEGATDHRRDATDHNAEGSRKEAIDHGGGDLENAGDPEGEAGMRHPNKATEHNGKEGMNHQELYCAPTAEAYEAAVAYVCEVEESFENTAKGWQSLVAKGNELVKRAGGVAKAAESLWQVREDRGLMNLQGIDNEEFDDVLHPDLLQYLRSIRREGMPARYVGSRHRVKAKLHPNAKRNVDQVYHQVAKDVKKHRALVVDGELEELGTTVSSPFEAVDKLLPDRSISKEKRIVHDQRTINKGTSKFWHPPALQPMHVQVARRVVWMKARFPGVPILMSKKDIAGAFRLIWVAPADVELFAGDLPWQPEKAFGENQRGAASPARGDITVIYLVSSFGFSGSPGEWTMWGRATEEYHRGHRPTDPRRDLGLGFDAKVLVDDCILIEPWIGYRPWVSAEVFEDGVKKMLGEKAINQEKDGVEGTFRTSQTVWGVIMETDTEKAMLPERRVTKGAVLLAETCFDFGRQSITLKQMQQFRGIMTGWASIVQGLSNELKAADKFLRGWDGTAVVEVNLKGDGTPEWERQKAWEDLWELFEVCRWLSARTDQWDLLFSTTLRRMLPPLERLALPQEWSEVVFVSSDATPTALGAIDWKHGRVFREKFTSLKPWIDMVLTDVEALENEDEVVIHLGEMLSFVAFACAMGPLWQGKVVIYAGDNVIVKHWLNSRRSRVRGGRLLVRVVNMVEMRWGCQILSGWWRTYHNVDADFITRCSDQEFEEYLQEKGWQEVSVKEHVHQALRDTELFGPCFLYSTDDQDRQVLMQLREKRVQRQLQKEVRIPWPHIKVVEWSASGREVRDFTDVAGHLGANIDHQGGEGPVILCATLGVDSQGRHLCKVLDAANTLKAWLAIVEGPRAVAWELGEQKCKKRGWDCAVIEFVTTEFGEAMARRRRCMFVSTEGILPEGWEESVMRAGAPVPVQTMLKTKPWEDLVWVRPMRLELESGIPRDKMLPNPVGHFFFEEQERLTCHGIDGPAPWPKIDENNGQVRDVLMFDRRGPPGHMRKLTLEEIWVLQGRSLADLRSAGPMAKIVAEGCRATGVKTASTLLLCAGHIVETKIGEAAAHAGGCREQEGPEALAQILVWLRKWRRGEFGRYAGGHVDSFEDRVVYRWAEAWWLSMMEDSEDEIETRRAGRRKKKVEPSEVAEKVSRQFVTTVGLQVRPFHGEVRERIDEWLEENMCGDKAPATEKAYASAWTKWQAWARRQGWLSEFLDRNQDVVERENRLLGYVGYLGWLGASANTIRQAIFAIKMAHKRVGAGDITEGMHRIWILLGGLYRRSTTRKPRRLGVTQEMLEWLGEELVGSFGGERSNPLYADSVMAFTALSTAWFYMLRAKEFGESNGVDMEMIIRGQDLRFSANGRPAGEDAEEVTLTFRKTKVDQLAFGDAKTLKATGRRPVEALVRMRQVWPNRFQRGHKESSLPLFRWASGTVLKRLEVQHLLQKAAEGVGLQGDRYMAHSLRIGGATALYQATGDIELVKRIGRWTSSAVHRYLEDGGTISNASRKMADVRLKNI